MAMTPNGLQSIEEMFVPTYGDGTLVCLYDYVCLSVCMYVESLFSYTFRQVANMLVAVFLILLFNTLLRFNKNKSLSVKDFARYLRHTTGPFPYDQASPSSQDHETMMQGRKFKVYVSIPPSKKKEETEEEAGDSLLLTTKKTKTTTKTTLAWKTGSVISFTEYTLGPLDVNLKLSLIARMDGDTGDMEGDTHGTENQGHADPGTKTFRVNRMNVNGGGTVCEDEGNPDTLISLEWIDPFVQSGRSPDGDGLTRTDVAPHDARPATDTVPSYYYDVTKRLPGMDTRIDSEQLQSMRDATMTKFDGMCATAAANSTDSRRHYTQEFLKYYVGKFHTHLTTDVEDPTNNLEDIIYNMRMDCLSMPFIPFASMIMKILQIGPNDKSKRKNNAQLHVLVRVIVECALVLRDDVRWMEQSASLDPHRDTYNQPQAVGSATEGGGGRVAPTQNEWFHIYYHRLVKECGEYYLSVDEFRAAIWTYKLNLTDPSYTTIIHDNIGYRHVDGLTTEEMGRMGYLACIGLLYKLLGNMELAFQYYRECISMTNKSNDHQNYVICTNNHNSFKAEAKEWIGTTGKLAPWTCGNSSGKNDTGSNDNHGGIPGSVNMIHCFVCKKETQLLSCTGCSALTKYCSRVCQTKDWSRHKLICFGCKREGKK